MYSPDPSVNELVVALIRDTLNPYSERFSSGGISTIVAVVRERLGRDAARSVRITLH